MGSPGFRTRSRLLQGHVTLHREEGFQELWLCFCRRLLVSCPCGPQHSGTPQSLTAEASGPSEQLMSD